MTSKYNKIRNNKPQNFDLDSFQTKLIVKWLQFSGTLN